jgi:hypothetical protein
VGQHTRNRWAFFGVTLAALVALLGCGNNPGQLANCLETVGRRPCDDKSIKYNAKKQQCGCQTKHRGWVVWDAE